jgi:hypothetical protein
MASIDASKLSGSRSPQSSGDLDGASNNHPQRPSHGRLRSASIKFLESSPPLGMWDATGNALAQAPTPGEIRRGSFSHNGWDGPVQRRNSTVSEESVRRLSRQNSAQTPSSIGRSPQSPLKTHKETADDDPFSGFFGRGEMADQSYVPKAKGLPKMFQDSAENEPTFQSRDLPNKFADPANQKPGVVKAPANMSRKPNDDDDDLDLFLGRGEMSDQSYVPKSKDLTNKSHDPDKDAPPYQSRGLPNKFADPTDHKLPEKSSAYTPAPIDHASSKSSSTAPGPDADGIYPTGYKFPPQHTWGEATIIGLKAFWKFTITPVGFLVVLYGLNVVAWGGMLFLLLIGGGNQYMCYPAYLHGIKACNDLYSPRRIWIETDSQILNALFCVTGFGLIPWRFRDLYYLLQYRVRGRHDALRKLAGINRGWFRLPGSSDLPIEESPLVDTEGPISSNPAIPIPMKKAPDPPLTGIRAPPTKLWKLDYVIWAYVLNTFLQAVLSGFMWGLNRFDRPSWSTGTFVALACIVAALGGLMAFQEGKRVKRVEGIPVKEEEMLRDEERAMHEKKVRKAEKKEEQKREKARSRLAGAKGKQGGTVEEKSRENISESGL